MSNAHIPIVHVQHFYLHQQLIVANDFIRWNHDQLLNLQGFELHQFLER